MACLKNPVDFLAAQTHRMNFYVCVNAGTKDLHTDLAAYSWGSFHFIWSFLQPLILFLVFQAFIILNTSNKKYTLKTIHGTVLFSLNTTVYLLHKIDVLCTK